MQPEARPARKWKPVVERERVVSEVVHGQVVHVEGKCMLSQHTGMGSLPLLRSIGHGSLGCLSLHAAYEIFN